MPSSDYLVSLNQHLLEMAPNELQQTLVLNLMLTVLQRHPPFTHDCCMYNVSSVLHHAG